MSNAEELTLRVDGFQAEMSMLGAMFLSEGGRVRQWAAANLTTQMFQRHSHRLIFSALIAMQRAGDAIDQITVESFLDRKGKLADIGGPDYLLELAMYVPSIANFETYGRYVLRDYTLRELRKRSADLYGFCDTEVDVSKALGKAHELTKGLFIGTQDTFDHSGDIDFEETGVRGISTGLGCIDRHVGEASEGGVGFPVGELSLVGGSTGHGKSGLMITSCAHACQAGRRPAYVTLEMPWTGVRTRLVQSVCGWSKAPRELHIRAEYLEACDVVKSWPVVYWDPSKRKGDEKTVEGLAAWVMQQRDVRGITEVYVDYAQLLNPRAKKENRTRELDYVADELKDMAARLDIPVIAGAQLSQDAKGEMRVKDCIRFEDNAALVVFIQRPKAKESDLWNEPCSLVVKKSRWGITGIENAVFDRRFVRFRDVDKPAKREFSKPKEEPFDEFKDAN